MVMGSSQLNKLSILSNGDILCENFSQVDIIPPVEATDCLRKLSKWTNSLCKFESMSEKINQLQQIHLIEGHIVWVNFLYWTIITWVVLYQVSIKFINRAKIRFSCDCSVEGKGIGTTICTIVFISKQISETFFHYSTLPQFNVRRVDFKTDWLG